MILETKSREELIKLIQDQSNHIDKLESRLVTLDNWKGKDSLFITRPADDVWHIIEHIKSKDDGKVKKSVKIIRHRRVLELWDILKSLQLAMNKKKFSYRDIVSYIIDKFDYDVELDAFNGGSNRATYYFPLYYYPIKIIESLGWIQYHGKGGVTIVKDVNLTNFEMDIALIKNKESILIKREVLINDDLVERTIKTKHLLEFVGKITYYVEQYPKKIFNTTIIKALEPKDNHGIYEAKIERKML